MKLFIKILLIFFDLLDEFFHQKKIKKFIEKNKIELNTYIDIGGFKGKYTDLILKIKKDCKVILIEPQKKYYLTLKEKYKTNKKIEVLNIGISDKKEKLQLKINKHEITSTFSEFNTRNRYLNFKARLFSSNLKNMTKNVENVEVLPLNEIIVNKNLTNIDLIKIDTEGHEFKVLSGAKDCIKSINYVLIEFHNSEIFQDYSSHKIHNFFIDNEFILKEKFKFPFTNWEDRIYKNSRFKN